MRVNKKHHTMYRPNDPIVKWQEHANRKIIHHIIIIRKRRNLIFVKLRLILEFFCLTYILTFVLQPNWMERIFAYVSSRLQLNICRERIFCVFQDDNSNNGKNICYCNYSITT